MIRYTIDQIKELELIINKAREALAIVNECQKQLRSKGIDCCITNDGTFDVKIKL